MRRLILVFALGILVFLAMSESCRAGEVDVLIEKLVEKGILTPVEAQIIRDETIQTVQEQNAAGKNTALPKWVQTIKIKGDFRLRYQTERRMHAARSRNRGRVRYRLGVESNVTNGVKVGAGLASGGADPRSTNQTFENSFQHPDLRLDYAYGEYAPNAGMKMAGGKFLMKDYLWNTTDFMWDSDINPEGASAHFERPLAQGLDGFFNGGVWVLDEVDGNTSGFTNTDHADPFMHYMQGGLKWEHAPDENSGVDATLAGIYYGFNGVKGAQLENDKDINTTSGSNLRYDYDSYGVSAKTGVVNVFGGLPMHIDEYIAVFGDYLTNPDPEEQNVAWAAGAQFGNKKVAEKGQWQAKYIYAWLGKDAILDTFPDSDRYGGSTDMYGHEAIVEYGLLKNVTLALDYYQTQRIKAAKALEHLFQADINFKF